MFLPFLIVVLLFARAPQDSAAGKVAFAFPSSAPVGKPSADPGNAVSSAPTSLLSIYAGAEDHESPQVLLKCRLDTPVDNTENRILITGMLAEDLPDSAGRVIIPVGSKIVGFGYCDPDRGRILARGQWVLYWGDHRLKAAGTLLDLAQREGMTGGEVNENENEARVKQAILRDGLYLRVPRETAFLVRLERVVSLQQLAPADR